ncbi:MAG: polymer-forming cytoskeletal protein [bacterium]|nr:polymer-forming cytoskeletal protein [bacterium]
METDSNLSDGEGTEEHPFLLTEVVSDDLKNVSPEMSDFLGEAEEDFLNAVSAGTVIEGRLSFAEAACIEGTLLGSLRSENILVVGREAEVEGEIDARWVIISGTVRGKVKARERIEIHRTAFVKAEISASELLIEKGACVSGHVDVMPLNRASSDVKDEE